MTLDYEIVVRKLSGKTKNNLSNLTVYYWLQNFVLSIFYLSLFFVSKSKIYKALTCGVGTIYTGCPRRNVPDFGRVFLMLKYTDITQNTYIQS